LESSAFLPQLKLACPVPWIFLGISGSHAYGFASADSDYDFRGWHVLPASLVLALEPAPETYQLQQYPIDFISHDIGLVLRSLLRKQDGTLFEHVYGLSPLYTSDLHTMVQELLQPYRTRFLYQHYMHFATRQWNAIIKEQRSGLVAVKTVLYMYRVLLTGIHALQTGQFILALPTLIQDTPYTHVQDWIAQKQDRHYADLLVPDPSPLLTRIRHDYETLQRTLSEAVDTSPLPTQLPELKPIAEFLVETRLRFLKGVV
jgi:predicted nucleotidyltransferase